MEKAKQAVSSFMNKAGHHDTTVHETVAPAVQNETVTPQRHENVTTAVDKEVHQDHYHTSVQPVHDREVLPEQHHHNQAPVEHREHHHGNKEHVAQKLQQEASQFKDHSTRTETQHTQAAAPVVAGEHVHHHVHENIQPVVHKQTVEPHVVHTTVPIHEVHHNAAQHHTTSALPAVHMADFKKQGGSLTGREERYDAFEGQPKTIGKSLGSDHQHDQHQHAGQSSGLTGGSGLNDGHHNHTATTLSGMAGNTARSGLGHNSNTLGHTGGSGLNDGHHNQNATTLSGTAGNTAGSGFGQHGNTLGHTSQRDSGVSGVDGTHKKASLMDKLNPKVDADGDGKAGFMK
jgi:hypothetical protein